MGDRLATIDMDRKEGAAVPLSGGGSWVPIYHTVIHPAVWPQQTLAKIGGAVPRFWGSGVPI